MDKREKKFLKSLVYRKLIFIRFDYKYLTLDIANEYAKKAENLEEYSESWNALRKELKKIYGVTDVEAINILRNDKNLIQLYAKVYKQIQDFEIQEEDIENLEKEPDDEQLIIDLDEDIEKQIDSYIFEEND